MPELELRGLPGSQGVAIGPAHRFRAWEEPIPSRVAGPFDEEWDRFEQARRVAVEELLDLRRRVAKRAGEMEASIFDAHRLMLSDPVLSGQVRQRLQNGTPVDRAVAEAAEEIAGQLGSMKDELFAARAADVRDVGRRVARILLGRPANYLADLREPSIIVAEDLTPSDTAALDPRTTLGFCTAAGGVTSHTAILARTLGLPAVVGMGETLMERIADGDELILDGDEGVVWVAPSTGQLTEYERRQEVRRRQVVEWRMAAGIEARTSDGLRVEMAANIGDVTSARQAAANGAEGIGLLRTEFLYLEATQPPSEGEQRKVYGDIFAAMAGKPIIVRSLDIGGDKYPPYLTFPQELNPFLGWRAIRVSLDRPDLFNTQVRAILQAAVGHDVRIMLPMISGVEEVRRARQMVFQAMAELDKEGRTFARDVPVGIMVETPAAAVLIDALAREADFFSLGTNDLTQYALAVDRGNSRVAALFQPLHPAVLRLVRTAIEGAHRAGKWIGMCGELAGMRKAVPILVGLGLDELSMAPGSIPEAKALIALLDSRKARILVDEVLALGTATEIEARVERFLVEIG